MTISVYEDVGGFEALRGEWNRLLARSATNTLFLTWEWQRAWWETFGAGRRHLRIVAERDEQGNLLSIAPLFDQETVLAPLQWDVAPDAEAALPAISVESPVQVTGGTSLRIVHLLGGTEVSDYLDVFAPAQGNSAAWSQILQTLEPVGWRILDLRSIPAASPSLTSVAEIARNRGWQVQQAREDVCPIIQLPSSWDEYLDTRLDKKQRHELRRKMRRAEAEAQVNWHWVNAGDLDAGLTTFIQLHKASHPDKDAFMDERMQGFFRKVACAALENGWLRLCILHFNGRSVASYLCFDYGQARLVYNSGFDLSAYADLGPGIVLLGYLIQDAIKAGCKYFDFLQGNERYKYEFGAVDSEVLRLLVRR